MQKPLREHLLSLLISKDQFHCTQTRLWKTYLHKINKLTNPFDSAGQLTIEQISRVAYFRRKTKSNNNKRYQFISGKIFYSWFFYSSLFNYSVEMDCCARSVTFIAGKRCLVIRGHLNGKLSLHSVWNILQKSMCRIKFELSSFWLQIVSYCHNS